MSNPNDQTITVDYATADGTALAGTDYAAQTGTLTFLAGETTKQITVLVNGDLIHEADETFTVNLSNPTNANTNATNATIGTGTGTGTIVDDDAITINIDRTVSHNEGNSGTTAFTFNVTLSNPNDQTITVDYATADGTALAGTDYTAQTGTLTFLAGETTKQITVLVNGDLIHEADETFTVNLSNPTNANTNATNATIGTGTGTGTIVDDDAITINIDSTVSHNEGNSGTTAFTFNVTLSNPNDQTITVDYATADGTALAGTDYAAQTGTLTFLAGETTKQITVLVNGDLIHEADETFTVNLSNPTNANTNATNATIGTGTGTGTIVDDDAITINIDSTVSHNEGNSGTTAFTFNVTLSNPNDQTITVDYATADGTALAGTDYTAQTGTLTFLAGETTKQITVLVNGDLIHEADETFTVNLSNPTNANTNATNATIGTGTGTGTIVDDDAITINIDTTVSHNEGNSGTTAFTFNVTLSNPNDQTITVDYATADGTALAGTDYAAQTGTLTFLAGETTKQITVLVNGDLIHEADETFTVNLSNPTNANTNATNATIGTGTGTGTIVDDDAITINIDSTVSHKKATAARQPLHSMLP